MSTKTRQTTPHVPTQRGEGRRSATNAPTAPPEHDDHRVRNISLLVATVVIAIGAVLVLWLAVFSGGDSPQAPTSPNNISQGTDNSRDFLRQQQEQPVGPAGGINGSDQRLYNQAPSAESGAGSDLQTESDPQPESDPQTGSDPQPESDEIQKRRFDRF